MPSRAQTFSLHLPPLSLDTAPLSLTSSSSSCSSTSSLCYSISALGERELWREVFGVVGVVGLGGGVSCHCSRPPPPGPYLAPMYSSVCTP